MKKTKIKVWRNGGLAKCLLTLKRFLEESKCSEVSPAFFCSKKCPETTNLSFLGHRECFNIVLTSNEFIATALIKNVGLL